MNINSEMQSDPATPKRNFPLWFISLFLALTQIYLINLFRTSNLPIGIAHRFLIIIQALSLVAIVAGGVSVYQRKTSWLNLYLALITIVINIIFIRFGFSDTPFGSGYFRADPELLGILSIWIIFTFLLFWVVEIFLSLVKLIFFHDRAIALARIGIALAVSGNIIAKIISLVRYD